MSILVFEDRGEIAASVSSRPADEQFHITLHDACRGIQAGRRRLLLLRRPGRFSVDQQ